MKADIPIDTLRRLLRLDENTGRLYWRPRPPEMFNGDHPERACRSWNARYAGAEAFTAAEPGGARQGAIFSARFSARRVVFALYEGRWPKGGVEPRNGNHEDHRPANLREASRVHRRTGPAARQSSYRGVGWDVQRERWRVAACVPGRRRATFIGYFDDEREAALAYDAWVRAHRGEGAYLNFPDEAQA